MTVLSSGLSLELLLPSHPPVLLLGWSTGSGKAPRFLAALQDAHGSLWVSSRTVRPMLSFAQAMCGACITAELAQLLVLLVHGTAAANTARSLPHQSQQQSISRQR